MITDSSEKLFLDWLVDDWLRNEIKFPLVIIFVLDNLNIQILQIRII